MASFASGLTVRTLPIVAAKIGRSTKSTVAISIRCLYPIHHFATKSGAANVAAPLLTNGRTYLCFPLITFAMIDEHS